MGPLQTITTATTGATSDWHTHATLDHPTAHQTLGHYHHCRIPTTAPVTPGLFVDFILTHFYGAAIASQHLHVPIDGHRFAATITVPNGPLSTSRSLDAPLPAPGLSE